MEPVPPSPSPSLSPPPVPIYPSSDSDSEISTDDDFHVFSPPSSDSTTSGFSSPGSAFHEPAVSPANNPLAFEAASPAALQPHFQALEAPRSSPPSSPPALLSSPPRSPRSASPYERTADPLLQRTVFSRPAPGHVGNILVDDVVDLRDLRNLRDVASGTSRRFFQPVPGSAFSRVYTVESCPDSKEGLLEAELTRFGNFTAASLRTGYSAECRPCPSGPSTSSPRPDS